MDGKRFIVIEPSIKSEAGHYLQYAKDVLRAAQNEGFKPILGCHRDFPAHPIGEIEVLPAFTHTFWHRYAAANDARGPVSKAYFQVIRIRNGIVLRLKASWFFSKTYLALGHICGPIASNKYSGTILRILALPFWIAWRIWSIGRFRAARIAIYNRFYKLADTLYAESAERTIPVFANDLVELGKKLGVTESDRLLLATVSGAELEGLIRAIEIEPSLAKPIWHLVFRRNLRTHPLADFGDDLETKLVRMALRRLDGTKANVSLHTDTLALTREYNSLSQNEPFTTLPIPHVKTRDVASPESGAKVVSYLGDARPEKGFQYLSRIASACASSLLDTKKARFKIQANFNIASGEPDCVVCRRELEKFPSDQVELLTEEQGEVQYKANLDESSVVLIPYDVNNYSERSSGIFAECVGAGVPVIVPSGTWMSRQLLGWSYPFLAELYQGARHVSPDSVQVIPAGIAGESDNPLENRWIARGGEPRFLLALNCPADPRQIILRLNLRDRQFSRIRIVCRDGGGVLIEQITKVLEVEDGCEDATTYALTDLPQGTERLQIEVLNSTISSLQEGDLGLAFNPVGKSIRFVPPGETYFEWTEIPCLLERMVDDQHETMACMEQYSRSFRAFHSPEGFMRAIGLRQGALVG